MKHRHIFRYPFDKSEHSYYHDHPGSYIYDEFLKEIIHNHREEEVTEYAELHSTQEQV